MSNEHRTPVADSVTKTKLKELLIIFSFHVKKSEDFDGYWRGKVRVTSTSSVGKVGELEYLSKAPVEQRQKQRAMWRVALLVLLAVCKADGADLFQAAIDADGAGNHADAVALFRQYAEQVHMG